jgi:CO/xanthine dehydrogenase FAD-binding subunit
VASAARLAEGVVTLSDDTHATRDYRKKIAGVTAERAVMAAVNRARGAN